MPPCDYVNEHAKATFLGTGTSTGVPVIGCDCPVCQSTDPHNKRLRSALWIEWDGISLLIDAGPDLRQHALRAGISKLDAVLYTHGHLDHVAGFDELRAFCWGKRAPLPLYANPGCMKTLQTMFAWAFSPNNTHGGYVKPDPRIFDGCFTIGSLRITPLPVHHAGVQTHGYRFDADGMKSLAYIPDAKSIPRSTLDLLHSCDILILDALREQPHPTHLCLAESLECIQQAAPRQAYLTHISHESEHHALQKRLPAHIRVAYDELTLTLNL
jgi:phosphoribosyl 1,2-cyclic phosphate phosphodiesterase